MKNNTAVEPLESRIAPAVVFAVEVDTNKLVSFDSAAPGTLLTDITITGMGAGEIAASIDFDQLTGTLYAMAVKDNGSTRSGFYYTVDTATGVATPNAISGVSGTLPDNSNFGFEVHQGTRVVTTTDDAAIGNESNGSFFTTFDAPNKSESVTAIAYAEPFSGNSDSTLYGYNYVTDELVTFGELYAGSTLTTVAKATLGGVNFAANNSQMGFDIAAPFGGAEQGWLNITKTGNGTHLYTMNLATAALTDLGAIGNGSRLFGGLTVSFRADAPAISADQKSATWTDIDGDAVTLKVTKGALTAANFEMVAGVQGSFLGELKLDAAFTGANITLSAKRAAGGDGLAPMGFLSAKGVDLGVVKISGSMAGFEAGDGNAPAPSVKSLAVGELNPASFGGPVAKLADGAGAVVIKGDFNGFLNLGNGPSGSLTLTGDLRGQIFGSGSLGKLLIKGSIVGGTALFSGKVTLPNVKSLTVGGSLYGGTGASSGIIEISGMEANTITIGGSVIGSSGSYSGLIEASGVTTAKIGGGLIGGSGSFSGCFIHGGLSNTNPSVLKSLTIGGSVRAADGEAGNPQTFGIMAHRIGQLLIKGSLLGTTAGTTSGVFVFNQGVVPDSQSASVALGKLTIGGDLKNAHIAVGNDYNLSAISADVAIGAVKIGGSMIASSITAGIDLVNKLAGDADDKFVGGNSGAPGIIAKIASVTIGGQLRGTAGGLPDSFGIIAEEIGSVTVGKVKLPLTAAKDDFTLGFTADVRVREL